MNSLNIISSRVSAPPSPVPTRSNSLSAIGLAVSPEDTNNNRSREHQPDNALPPPDFNEKDRLTAEPEDFSLDNSPKQEHDNDCAIDDTTPLIAHAEPPQVLVSREGSPWVLYPKRIASAIVNSIRWMLSTLAAPGVYLIACLYNESGEFAPLQQLRTLFGFYGGDAKMMALEYHENMSKQEETGKNSTRTTRSGSISAGGGRKASGRFLRSSGSSSSGLSSESDSDPDGKRQASSNSSTSRDMGGKHLRSKSLPQDTEEIAPARRSIRIKLHADDTLRQRKHRKAQSTSAGSGDGQNDISAHLKSPTSPIAALTKYPKTPAPPRPLIPRRQPSYINTADAIGATPHQKTLILDLDETLIHSMSKGGRMSSGHMVEVRLNTTYVAMGGQASIGPQHPILYYVHKRPHCDEFLRRVSKWFNLVVFTASVQEYADPVIDWLEADRKYFSARYYRQHCTFRHGAFIKDLSSVEPDLSKVMILDNSPLSYMFHQDNAIPIQGWISDPTDSDLMYLIPFLEGMQYVSDVRALLALRGGEDDLPPVKPSAIALGTIFNQAAELAVLSPLFGQTYQRAKVANSKEEFARSREAASAVSAWGSTLVGSALQSYGVGALINATGTLSYKGAAYLGALIFAATSAPTFIGQLLVERRSLETVGVSVLAKLFETVGLSVFMTWWGTRTGPLDL
ncbi:NLI interacting factor-like phosphatase-domain-containing protein [Cladorrhinum sp. PSN259]|nr:NLI interacting factor-like phosphatase-domain-containing protein [Cladorrhinum sp. PSN259]